MRIGAWPVAILSVFVSMTFAETVWIPNIPDAYQHQRWGAKPGGPTPITGALDLNGDRVEIIGAGVNQRVFGWEISRAFNPPYNAAFFQANPDVPNTMAGRPSAIANFAGWCNYTAYVNQFYHYKQQGINVTTGAVDNSDQLHDEIRQFAKSMQLQPGGLSTKSMNNVLAARVGKKTKDAVVGQNYLQGPNGVQFRSSTGVTKNLPKTTLMDHLLTISNRKDTAALRMRYDGVPNPNEGQSSLWWKGSKASNVHVVTVAGYETGQNGISTVWFADPDSNPFADANNDPTGTSGAAGNRNDNAGWSEALEGLGNQWSAASSDNWLNPSGNALRVKQRRFDGGAAVPTPAAAIPTAAERDRLYFEGTLSNDRKSLNIGGANGGAGFKRYNGVEFEYLETLEIVKAGNKPFVPTLAGDSSLTFQISPGQSGAGLIDQILLSTASTEEAIFDVSHLRVNNLDVPWTLIADPNNLVAGMWNIYFNGIGSLDWAGNELPYGGVSILAGPGVAPLSDLDLLEFDFVNAGLAPLTAWDFMYNYSPDTSLHSFGVQVEGGGFDLTFEQTPEPSTLALIACLAPWLVRRRARTPEQR